MANERAKKLYPNLTTPKQKFIIKVVTC